MSRQSQAWIRLPLAVLKQIGLTKTDAIILALIIDRCIDQSDRTASISSAWLADAAGCSVRQVTASSTRLEQLELIERTRTGRATRYALTDGVELLPPKRRQRNPKSDHDGLDEYLALVNRFSRTAPPTEPTEGG